jgi:methylisocitrate lyase
MSAKVLKKLIEGDDLILTPGVFDALTSILAEKAGFKATVMGGYSVSATRLGMPDVGLLTMSEMTEQIRQITDASPLPLIADGDTGFGNEINVRRTVKEYIKAGASALILEDQSFPKRCGHMSGKSVVSKEEHARKISAAKDAGGDDILVFARTDSLAVCGFDEAISRSQYYLRSGADAVFVEAPKDENEIIMIGRHLKSHPLIINNVEGGKTPVIPLEQLKKMGYKIVIYPLTALYIYAKSVFEGFKELKEKGDSLSLSDKMLDFENFNNLIGLDYFFKNKY